MGRGVEAGAVERRAEKRRRLAIMRLLKTCKDERRQASIEFIKQYLAGLERQGNLLPETREARHSGQAGFC